MIDKPTLISSIRSRSSKNGSFINLMRQVYNAEPVEAVHDDDFTAYDFNKGGRVPHGHPIGYEIEYRGKLELVLFADIRYSDTCYSTRELAKAGNQ